MVISNHKIFQVLNFNIISIFIHNIYIFITFTLTLIFIGKFDDLNGEVLVKICDFDSARIVGDFYPVSKDGILKYTLDYVSPEVYFGKAGKLLAQLSIDLFALGLVSVQILNKTHVSVMNQMHITDKDRDFLLTDQNALNEKLKLLVVDIIKKV